jgi:hypothetical protein
MTDKVLAWHFLAAEAVRFWASQVGDTPIAREAMRIAAAMEAWPVKKEPD